MQRFIILKVFKLAVRVVRYKDRVKLHLPTGCPVQGLLHQATEILYQAGRFARPQPT